MERFPWHPTLRHARVRETWSDRSSHSGCARGRGRGGDGRDVGGPDPNGCPTDKSTKPAPIAQLTPPARLQIEAFDVLSGPINEQSDTFTLKVRIGSTCSRDVIGASVYVTAVPYNQFTIPAEELTGNDGTATLVFRRDANFPASDQQQQLTLFIRATKPGEDPLGGISSRRLSPPHSRADASHCTAAPAPRATRARPFAGLRGSGLPGPRRGRALRSASAFAVAAVSQWLSRGTPFVRRCAGT